MDDDDYADDVWNLELNQSNVKLRREKKEKKKYQEKKKRTKMIAIDQSISLFAAK